MISFFSKDCDLAIDAHCAIVFALLEEKSLKNRYNFLPIFSEGGGGGN